MLRELPSTKQVPGERYRRWFFCHEADLVVWFDADGTPTGFQLAYDKYQNEHSISWHAGTGFRHDAVDEGNPLAGEAETPLLYPHGEFDAKRVIALFTSLSAEMPQDLARFVIEKLGSYPPRSSA
jgi:hypothetical protein